MASHVGGGGYINPAVLTKNLTIVAALAVSATALYLMFGDSKKRRKSKEVLGTPGCSTSEDEFTAECEHFKDSTAMATEKLETVLKTTDQIHMAAGRLNLYINEAAGLHEDQTLADFAGPRDHQPSSRRESPCRVSYPIRCRSVGVSTEDLPCCPYANTPYCARSRSPVQGDPYSRIKDSHTQTRVEEDGRRPEKWNSNFRAKHRVGERRCHGYTHTKFRGSGSRARESVGQASLNRYVEERREASDRSVDGLFTQSAVCSDGRGKGEEFVVERTERNCGGIGGDDGNVRAERYMDNRRQESMNKPCRQSAPEPFNQSYVREMVSPCRQGEDPFDESKTPPQSPKARMLWKKIPPPAYEYLEMLATASGSGAGSSADQRRAQTFVCWEKVPMQEGLNPRGGCDTCIEENCEKCISGDCDICIQPETNRCNGESVSRDSWKDRVNHVHQDSVVRRSTQQASQVRGTRSSIRARQVEQYTAEMSGRQAQVYLAGMGCLQTQQKKKVRWTPNTVEPSSDGQDYRRRPRSMYNSPLQQRPVTSYAYERPRLQSQAAKNTITGSRRVSDSTIRAFAKEGKRLRANHVWVLEDDHRDHQKEKSTILPGQSLKPDSIEITDGLD